MTACLLIVLLLPFALLGADEVQPAATPVPLAFGVPFRLQYNGGQLALKPGEVSHLDGGVKAWYEQVHLHSQSLEWTQSVVTGATSAVLDTLRLAAGPDSYALDRVLLDTRATKLPLVGFRGLLTPARIDVVRQPPDPAVPGQARWKATLAQPGFFAGDLLTKTGWVPHAGWADEIQFDVIGDLGPAGISAPRFAAIHFFGRQAAQAKDRVRCRLDRLTTPLAKPEDLATTPTTAVAFGYQGLSLTILFDAQGRYESARSGQMSEQYGVPPIDLPLRAQSSLGAGK